MSFRFSKYQGTGNDFLITDALSDFELLSKNLQISVEELVKFFCERRFGIGADGFILIEKCGSKYRWKFFNSDGSSAKMCGNGARCAVDFIMKKYGEEKVILETEVFEVKGEKTENGIKISFPFSKSRIKKLEVEGYKTYFLTVGVPHAVIFVEDIESVDVEGVGRKIRFSSVFGKEGTNVNFVQYDGELKVRTYERGVEGETYACGTGSVAVSFVAISEIGVKQPVKVKTKGGELTVSFSEDFSEVFLEGEVVCVFEGEITGEFEKWMKSKRQLTF